MGSPSFNYIILGAAIVLFVVTLVKDWKPFSKKKEKKLSENNASSLSPQGDKADIVLPLCLQAYERLVVFLERMRLESLVKRLNRPELTVKETEHLFIESIRAEFEHNVSQQIYLSDASWEAVSTAKEQVIHYIHITASKLSPSENGRLLSQQLLSQPFHESHNPVKIALDILNNESDKLINRSQR